LQQTLLSGASLKLALTSTSTAADSRIKELSDLFYQEIVPAVFNHGQIGSASSAVMVHVTILEFAEAPALETLESYTLDFGNVSQSGIRITANTQLGAIHAFETLAQLTHFDFGSLLYALPKSCSIQDAPRFKHRGLLVDTVRHYLPIPKIEQLIRTMRMNKLNVLHWHIADIQSFPIRSEVFPELSARGSWSPFEQYSLPDLARLVDFARRHGVRVVAEFDQPGHSGAMWWSHPEIFACDPPWTKKDIWGLYEGVGGLAIDPTSEVAYTFMNKLMGEMLGVFTDEYFHIGTDEVPEDCWTNLAGGANANFQYYIDRTVRNFTTGDFPIKRKPRKVIMWDEAIMKAEPADKENTVIEIWHEAFLIKNATDRGYKVIVSSGTLWYLKDQTHPWTEIYQFDPVAVGVNEKMVLGGEACMWGEGVDASNIEAYVWPRMSAVAERLWSVRNDTQNLISAQERLTKFRCLMVQRGVDAVPIGGKVGSRKGPGSCFERESNVAPTPAPTLRTLRTPSSSSASSPSASSPSASSPSGISPGMLVFFTAMAVTAGAVLYWYAKIKGRGGVVTLSDSVPMSAEQQMAVLGGGAEHTNEHRHLAESDSDSDSAELSDAIAAT
jgi:hexosaminidase